MNENDMMREWLDGDTSRDGTLRALFCEMDSVKNLNCNPMAVRIAGTKAARISFMLGVRFAEKMAEESALCPHHSKYADGTCADCGARWDTQKGRE